MIPRALRLLAAASVLALLSTAPAGAVLVTLTGSVTDPNGGGIFGVQIGFVDSCTGVTAAATGNITSSTGAFRATVNSGIYDVEFTPPAGSLFVAYRIRNFDLTASRVLAPIALPFGVTVAGRVTDAGGTGIAGVSARFFPPGAGERIFTVRDKTDLSGTYSVVVPPGTYDVKYGPPAGTRYLGLVRPSVAIGGNTTLQTVALATGLVVSGTVFDSAGAGQPVINVNINATDAATGSPVFLSHDRTDATGAYSVVVLPGDYRFAYKPGKCTLLVALETPPTAVTADLALPPVTLVAGVLVRGNVTDVRGAPVFDVNTNYISAATGLQALTFEDHTDAAGAYSAVAPPDLYNVEYAPPAGVRLAGVKTYGVDVRASTTLPDVLLPDAVFVGGRTVRVDGLPLSGIDLDFFPAGSTAKIYTPHDVSGPDGRFSVAVAPGAYDVRFEPPSTLPYATKLLRGIQAGADADLGEVVIVRGHVVTGRVTDGSGAAVANADLDFFDVYTGAKADTLHDNTDVNGDYGVVVPDGLFDVAFVPPAGLLLETVRIAGLPITSALSGLNVVLRAGARVRGRLFDPFSSPVAGVDLDFFDSATGARRAVSRDNSVSDGSFEVFVPAGTYDITFTPPSTAGLAPARLTAVPIPGDTDLGDMPLDPALTPTVASMTPSAGPTSGGTAVTILGSSFQQGATCSLGGIDLLSPRIVDPGRIDAVTPGWPAGPGGAVTDLVVANRGAPPATLPSAFSYLPPAVPVEISVSRSSPNIVLTWPATGQAFYTIYRSTSPAVFGQAQIIAITGGTSFAIVGGDADGVNHFYRVE